MKLSRWTAGALAGALAFACMAQAPAKKGKRDLKREAYGKMPDGTPIERFTLSNANGMQVAVTNFGATVVSIAVPDRNGKVADVTLGMDDLEGYRRQTAFFGALVGRYGNRIAHGAFTLEGKHYQLPKNDGDNTLHGGLQGFNRKAWKANPVSSPDGDAVEMAYTSPDGEEGFPGALSARVVYTLTAKNELKIDYFAKTDKPTVLNLTNHSYFNLAGEGSGDVLQHQVTINASRFTPVNKSLIPTGELKPVAGTPFDFTKGAAIGSRIGQTDEQLQFGRGYDHNWVLEKGSGGLTKAAEVHEPRTGRIMEVWTTEPGMQFYTGNFLDGSIHGKGGKIYPARSAFCMETQHFPDSPNQPKFPSTELKPGAEYRTTTVYRFSAK
jgi:aldose 1-epimerase